jgi:hypothetical protein
MSLPTDYLSLPTDNAHVLEMVGADFARAAGSAGERNESVPLLGRIV